MFFMLIFLPFCLILLITPINGVGVSMAVPHRQTPFVPLYQQLADEYKQAITMRRLKPGDRIDSINDIISKHQVSRETAKLVLKILAREGFIVQHAGKGSFVANLRPMKKLWGVILPFFSNQYQDLLYELSQQAWAAGRQLHSFVDYNNWEEEIRLVGQLINDRYEAIVIVPTLDESKTAAFYKRLSSRESHVVLIDHTMAGSSFSYVIQSYDLGVRRAVAHLLERSRDGKLVFVHNEITLGRNLVQEMMEETFKAALDDAGIAERALVVDRAGRIDAAFVKANDIRGVFSCDDTDAIRIIGKLKEQEIIVGRDFALVSYGNTELARYFTPAITSVDPHNSEMAGCVAGILKSKINEEDTSFCQYIVQPELLVRET